MDQEQDLDLLDLEEDAGQVDTLPEATPFTTPRPKKPWLLMGLGVLIIVLATWIIIARVGSDSGTTVNIDLDAPVQNVDSAVQPVADLNVPAKPAEKAAPVAKTETKKVEAKPVESNGTPVRVVEDRKEVTFDPDKATTKPVAKTVAKPASKPVTIKPAVAASSNGSIYVQFGSYSTRASAQSAEKRLRASHSNLFSGKQFVILAAQVNGKTTYRLRVAFQNAGDANGFCRNAKSDGVDCYVTK